MHKAISALHHIKNDADQECIAIRRTQTRTTKLGHHLGHSQAVVLTYVIEETHGMVLGMRKTQSEQAHN